MYLATFAVLRKSAAPQQQTPLILRAMRGNSMHRINFVPLQVVGCTVFILRPKVQFRLFHHHWFGRVSPLTKDHQTGLANKSPCAGAAYFDQHSMIIASHHFPRANHCSRAVSRLLRRPLVSPTHRRSGADGSGVLWCCAAARFPDRFARIIFTPICLCL